MDISITHDREFRCIRVSIRTGSIPILPIRPRRATTKRHLVKRKQSVLPFRILETEARTILSPVSGFLRQAGFTHSLTPARNCTFGCTYCYVPTMRVQGGLKPEDWRHWGEHTTFKINAADLLRRTLRSDQVIYCSPLTDPYQPAEEQTRLMPGILQATAENPPRAFVIQTRGPLILRDLPLLKCAAAVTQLRVSFSVTTDRDRVRRVFEPHCPPIEQRWNTVEMLQAAGIQTSVAIAPILPCDPESMIDQAVSLSAGPIVCDPFHVRAVKRAGATTRDAAVRICEKHGWQQWLDPAFQETVLARMRSRAASRNRAFGNGPAGFGLLVRCPA